MEDTVFDATLGGSKHLPHSANSLKFAASRSVEIAAMTENILRPSKTKLIFQSLPTHMRRRVMSHNSKRLPRKLRQAHLEQLKKSGIPPNQKRPSRKYRRRPVNLLEDYNRRQKQNKWLETHIWHAKRFHMTERWGYRLAYAPCDKAFRASYRATSVHCLIQDISYYTPILIKGPIEMIKDMFAYITNNSCGLRVCAKAYIAGDKEGKIHLYDVNMYPFCYIGKVQFIWVPNDSVQKCLWLFVHPSLLKQVESVLTNVLNPDVHCNSSEFTEKRRKIMNNLSDNIEIKVLPGIYNRFSLTGPNSHAVLMQTLKCVSDQLRINHNHWVTVHNCTNLFLKEKDIYWKSLYSITSPSQLTPNMVMGLVVRDPRLYRPTHRTKARCNYDSVINTNTLLKPPTFLPMSPLWDLQIQEIIKSKLLTNGQFIEHITKKQIVPGEVNEDDPILQSIPIVLIQRPGSQDANLKKIGYGSGWDIIVPSGYGMPFWLTFIMFGARSGGLRETENLTFEMSECYIPPDSDAGKAEQNRIKSEMSEKYFKLPPSKRVNYLKLGINSPFSCPWNILLNDWCNVSCENFFVLRNKSQLDMIQDCLAKKKCIPEIENHNFCLIAVHLKLMFKGSLKRHALICLPEANDICNVKELYEPQHEDPNEKLRKIKKSEHLKHIRCLRRKNIKLKKKGIKKENNRKPTKQEPSEYVKSMREMWLPSDVKTVRHFTSRQVMGFITQGAFSFSEAKCCGIGYVTFNALNALLKSGINQALVRNTSSRKYRLSNIQIIRNV